MLNKHDESGHFCLIPDLRGKAFSFLRWVLALGLSYMEFIMLRYVSTIPTLLRVFIISGCWILSNAFSTCIEIIRIFIFCLVSVVCQINWFVDIEPSLHPWFKSHLIMVYDPSNVLFNLVASILFLINYFLTALGLSCCVQAFSSCVKWGLLFVVVHGLSLQWLLLF